MIMWYLFYYIYACLLVSRCCFMTYTSHCNNEDQMKPCNVDSDWKTNYPLTGLHIWVAGPAYCSCMPLYGQYMGFILTLLTKHSHKWPPRTFASPQDTVWNGHRVELQHMCNLQWYDETATRYYELMQLSYVYVGHSATVQIICIVHVD